MLENYRRIQENELFDKVLHDSRMKRAYLKHESQNVENLIEDFGSKFNGYKYLENTNGDRNAAAALTSLDFMQEQKVFDSMKQLHKMKKEYHRLVGEG